jgi:high-affinity nickel-transport protein
MDAAALLPVAALTWALGLRHGLDPDHLAIVDGLTRHSLAQDSRNSRLCGVWFSLGHGAVVTACAALWAAFAADAAVPAWLEGAGLAISITFLCALGAINLERAIWGTQTPFAPRAAVFGRLARTSHPVLIAGIGAAFAVSFDTLGQAALFAVAGGAEAGLALALLLGALFTAGMLVADAACGALCFGAVRAGSARFTRALTAAIGILSLAIAAAGLARLASPRFDAFYDGAALPLGLALLAGTCVAAIIALRRHDHARKAAL